MSDHGGDPKKDSLLTTTTESSVAEDAHPDRKGPTYNGTSPVAVAVATVPRPRTPPPPSMAFCRLEQCSPQFLTDRIRNSNGMDPRPQHCRSHSRQLSSTSLQLQADDNHDLTTSLLPPSTHDSNAPQPMARTGLMFYSQMLRNQIQRIKQNYLTHENRHKFRRFIRRFGDYLASLSLLTMLVVVPIVLYRALSNRELDRAAYRSAQVMVVGTIVLLGQS